MDVVLPLGHVVHSRFAVALPAALTYVPGAQSLHTAQLVWFAIAVKLPAAQAVQVRFTVSEGVFETYLPGSHVAQSTHVEAAFASWSHVPAAHACLGVDPPAQ